MYFNTNLLIIIIDYGTLCMCSPLSTLVDAFSLISDNNKIMINNNNNNKFICSKSHLALWLIGESADQINSTKTKSNVGIWWLSKNWRTLWKMLRSRVENLSALFKDWLA